jgi:hypothetical protein
MRNTFMLTIQMAAPSATAIRIWTKPISPTGLQIRSMMVPLAIPPPSHML